MSVIEPPQRHALLVDDERRSAFFVLRMPTLKRGELQWAQMPQRLSAATIWIARKTKMAPQNYGAIHTKEKVFASGIESSRFHRTPTHSHYQRPIYGTSPLRMFDSAQAISNRSSLTKS